MSWFQALMLFALAWMLVACVVSLIADRCWWMVPPLLLVTGGAMWACYGAFWVAAGLAP